MKKVSLTSSKITKITNWLKHHGAEIMPTTNPYEVLRAKTNQGAFIVCRNQKSTSHSVNDGLLLQRILSWMGAQKPIQLSICGKKERKVRGMKNLLLKRDGDKCLYCGESLGDDITVEHILSIAHGGSNRIENLALCHEQCNYDAGDLPVVEKIKLIRRIA